MDVVDNGPHLTEGFPLAWIQAERTGEIRSVCRLGGPANASDIRLVEASVVQDGIYEVNVWEAGTGKVGATKTRPAELRTAEVSTVQARVE